MDAKLNITVQGYNGDYNGLVPFDANAADVRRWATEAVQSGSVRGIPAIAIVDFTDFVVEPFEPTADLPARLVLRPKTPFGSPAVSSRSE